MILENWKEVVGVIAAILSSVGYIPYIIDCYKGKTTPHFFSWSLWTLLNTIVFAFLLLEGGGPAAWPIGATSVSFGFILYFSLKKKSLSRIQKSDLILFILGLLAIPVWLLAKNPTVAIAMVSVIEFTAFLPTFRKTLQRPFEETMSSYVIASVKYILVLLTLDSYNFKLLVNPLMWLILNVVFVGMLIFLRRNKNAGIA